MVLSLRRLCVAAALAALVAARSSPADAQRLPSLSSQHRAATALWEHERFAEAREAYRAIFQRASEPRALTRWGLADLALRDWREAEQHLADALRRGDDRWIRRNRARIEGALAQARAHLGAILVECDTLGATVRVDQGDAVALPMSEPARRAEGEVAIVVVADGYEPLSQRVVIPGGAAEPVRVRVTLTRRAEVVARTPTEAPAPVVAPIVAPPQVRVAPRAPSPLRPIGVAAISLGAAGVALGVVSSLLREDRVGAFNTSCWLDANDAPLGGGACDEIHRAGVTWERVSTTGYIVGASLAVTGAVLLLAAPSREGRPAAVQVACGPWARAWGATCRMRF